MEKITNGTVCSDGMVSIDTAEEAFTLPGMIESIGGRRVEVDAGGGFCSVAKGTLYDFVLEVDPRKEDSEEASMVLRIKLIDDGPGGTRANTTLEIPAARSASSMWCDEDGAVHVSMNTESLTITPI